MRKLTACLALLAACLLPGAAQPRIPENWPFVEFNEAVQIAQRTGKPMFVYFGFATCPYCIHLNQHTLSDEALRKRYAANYVLAYFDVRANRNDIMTLPGGEQVTRADAIRRFKGNIVPAWMFMDAQGMPLLNGRGSRTGVASFQAYDLYVAGGAYHRMTFDEFLVRYGLTVD